MRAALATLSVSIALLVAPAADALIAHHDARVLPHFVPPIDLSAGSRIETTVEGDTVVLHGYVEDALRHFLVRRAIAARTGASLRIVDRVLVLPARGDGVRSAYPDGERDFCRLNVGSSTGGRAAPGAC